MSFIFQQTIIMILIALISSKTYNGATKKEVNCGCPALEGNANYLFINHVGTIL